VTRANGAPSEARCEPARVHLAIVRPRYLRLILRGEKTAEARLGRTRRLPYTGLEAGAVIYFKASGGPIGARAVARRVHRFELRDPADLDALRRRFERALGGPSTYWDEKASARYATIIELAGVEPVAGTPAWFRPASDRSAWRVCETA